MALLVLARALLQYSPNKEVAYLALYPFYYILMTSFEHPETILRVYFWPIRFFYANYYIVLSTPGLWWAFFVSVARFTTAVPAMLLVTSAAVMVALVPIVMVYPLMQRFFVKGVLIGSIKE